MIAVLNYLEVQNGITIIKNINKKIVTNIFLDEVKISKLIQEQNYFKIEFPEVLFFVNKRAAHYVLSYAASSLESLKLALKNLNSNYKKEVFIADIIAKEENPEIKQIFQQVGFSNYTSLVRMSSMRNNDDMVFEKLENLKEANINQVSEILALFHQYFDPKAEQIPNELEIKNWIVSGSLLIYEVENKIAGFIIFDLNGVTLYLRYWFVHPEYREQKIGSKLFQYFLYKGKNSKRQLFWVITTNENAIKRYKHYGFKQENMFNFVLINKKIKHEE